MEFVAGVHLLSRFANYGTGGTLFVFKGATRRRERALEYLHLPRIETQDFNGAEALRYV